jgi:hypothetical protein
MAAEFGRITGPLLARNLLRNGVDLAFETDLLYLKVSPSVYNLNPDDSDGNPQLGDSAIGINTDAPTSPLTVNGLVRTTNLIAPQTLTTPEFTIGTNTIQNVFGTIYIQPAQISSIINGGASDTLSFDELLDAGESLSSFLEIFDGGSASVSSGQPIITAAKFGTLNLRISDKLIENITNNSDINLRANGTGSIVFNTSEVRINGDLSVTGNVTWDGSNITFGNTDSDNVVFNADIDSNLIPNQDATYDLGSAVGSKIWNRLYVTDLINDTITAPSLTINNIDLLLTQGNTIYVSINGSDTNTGEHAHSTFRTVKHALSVSQSGDEIVIFPGTYQEAFPLIVPQGVSVKGAGVRAVSIEPTLSTNDKNAFLLNGDTTISFLTVQNFYYNETNNTGYAFSFAPNFKTLSRSPYVYNVTVITKGSVTTSEDPRGFLQGDAGGGAYLDGSLVDPTGLIPPSGLFFSVTFITPNQDGITGTNGARIEWLNSFTYFAKRGIYLTQGALGRAGQGTVFGAEMRSINSANVYGTYGAVADGEDTLAYLIGHNFGYIGTGNNSFNDRGLVVQANEVVEINNGNIYYDSMDHKGDYRIGNIFYVNQETGQVVFDAQSINFGASGSIVLEGPSSTTIIDATMVQTGNIRVHDNTVESLIGPVNLLAASGSTYLNTNVFVTGLATISANLYTDGTIYLGNDPYDLINVAPNLTQNINPKTTDTYTLGTDDGIDPKRWNTALVTGLNIDGVVEITNNTISTLTTDTDLELVASGTGKIQISNTNVEISENLTINNTVTVNGVSSLQDTEITGTTTLVGNISQTGNTYITGTFDNVNIEITDASYFEVNDIRLFNNNISATSTNDDLTIVATGTGAVIVDSALAIKDDLITNVWTAALTDEQRSIKFSPNGTGNTVVNTTKSLVLPLGNNTTKLLSTAGEIRYNTLTALFEGQQPNGLVSFKDLYDSDRNTYITAELTPGTDDNTLRFGINNLVRATITSTSLVTPVVHVDNVNITSNTINNLIGASDLELAPNGNGYASVNGMLFSGNAITNNTNGALTISSTGVGYVRFDGTGGVVMAYGTSSERRPTPEVGEIRNNTTIGYMEVYSGDPLQGDDGWIPAIGTSGAATTEQVYEIMDEWTLILG